MSIIIQNVDENFRLTGVHKYVLRINNKVIAHFTHKREDGLAACLRRAADAAEQPGREEVEDSNDLIRAITEYKDGA